MAAQQARLEQLEQDYQNALHNFNQQEAQARDHYKQEHDIGITQGNFPTWALQNAPAATVAYTQWQSVTGQLNQLRAQMQIPGMKDEQKKQMKRSSKFTGQQYPGISDNADIEDI